MNLNLTTIRRQFALVCLGDIVTFPIFPQEHIRHVHKVLTLFHNAFLSLKLKKFWLFTKTVDYLGLVTSPWRLVIGSHLTNAISELQHFTNLTNFCPFLELSMVFRQLVPTFARMAASLIVNCKNTNQNYLDFFNDEEFKSMNLL